VCVCVCVCEGDKKRDIAYVCIKTVRLVLAFYDLKKKRQFESRFTVIFMGKKMYLSVCRVVCI
jgi:hypothetical protein